MKWFVIFNLSLILLTNSGCQSNVATPKPSPTPKKKAEFKREVFDVEKYPGLTAVGKVVIGLQSCSLTLVAEDIAVTAGHCFLVSNIKFELNKEINPIFTEVIFKPDGKEKLPNIKVERVLKWKMDPDFAIVKLNKKIPESVIKPLKISDMEYAEILRETEVVGCAGFNGDKGLGNKGKNLTISRNIKILYETSTSERFDTNCVSTFGGSGGLFFEEKFDTKTKSNEYYFLGVIWGVTDDNFDIKGEVVNDKDIITSITPVKVFKTELMEIIYENK